MEAGARPVVGVRGRDAVVAHVVTGRGSLAKLVPLYAALADGGLVVQRLIVVDRPEDPLPRDLRTGARPLPRPDAVVAGGAPRGRRGGRILGDLERALDGLGPAMIVVAGGGDAALSAVLAGSRLRLDVCHLEAGLRSFDDARPDEHNRRLIDRLSTVLLAESEDTLGNVLREDLGNRRASAVGNTLVDTLFRHADSARVLACWRRYGLRAGDYVLVALHGRCLSPAVLGALDRVARSVPVLVAPRPPAAAPVRQSRRLRVACESGYQSFVSLVTGAAAVVTDSGGVQVETTALRVPCFTLAQATEHVDTVVYGTNQLLGGDPQRLRELVALLGPRQLPLAPPPLWDGHAGVRAARAVERALGIGLAVVA
jgi:UDP-N-acetylglucosamine 2-epimerase (non-hydrolysing)